MTDGISDDSKKATYLANAAIAIGIIKSLCSLTLSYQIIAQHNTEHLSAKGSISSLILAILGIRHALLGSDRTFVMTHILQVIVDSANILTYLFHSNSKWEEVILPCLKGSCVVAVGMIYTTLENPEKVVTRFGACLGALSVTTLAAPFYKLKKMFGDNDIGPINRFITVLSIIASLLWVFVALAVNNTIMLVQNICCFILNTIYLIATIVYRYKTPPPETHQHNN